MGSVGDNMIKTVEIVMSGMKKELHLTKPRLDNQE